MRRKPGNLVVPAITLALLGAVLTDRLLFHLPPDNAEAYQQQVREVAARFPREIGSWVGEDVPLPRSAITLLKPNVLFSAGTTSRAAACT